MTTTTTRRPRPAAIILTPSAEERIAELMAKAPEGAIGVKLSTPRRGCSGLLAVLTAGADRLASRCDGCPGACGELLGAAAEHPGVVAVG